MKWLKAMFTRPAPAVEGSAVRKADRAIAAMRETAEETRSLTDKLQRLYVEKGRDGFKAFQSDVALAEQLARYVKDH
jgi:hypothetical protein